MPPPLWATDEQTDLLEDRLIEYRKLQPTKHYIHFWAQLFEVWFEKWPEMSTLFPDRGETEVLTEEETRQLGKAKKVRRKVRHAHLTAVWHY